MAGNLVFAVSDDSINLDDGWQTSAPLVSNTLPISLLWLQQTMIKGNWQNDATNRHRAPPANSTAAPKNHAIP